MRKKATPIAIEADVQRWLACVFQDNKTVFVVSVHDKTAFGYYEETDDVNYCLQKRLSWKPGQNFLIKAIPPGTLRQKTCRVKLIGYADTEAEAYEIVNKHDGEVSTIGEQSKWNVSSSTCLDNSELYANSRVQSEPSHSVSVFTRPITSLQSKHGKPVEIANFHVQKAVKRKSNAISTSSSPIATDSEEEAPPNKRAIDNAIWSIIRAAGPVDADFNTANEHNSGSASYLGTLKIGSVSPTSSDGVPEDRSVSTNFSRVGTSNHPSASTVAIGSPAASDIENDTDYKCNEGNSDDWDEHSNSLRHNVVNIDNVSNRAPENSNIWCQLNKQFPANAAANGQEDAQLSAIVANVVRKIVVESLPIVLQEMMPKFAAELQEIKEDTQIIKQTVLQINEEMQKMKKSNNTLLSNVQKIKQNNCPDVIDYEQIMADAPGSVTKFLKTQLFTELFIFGIDIAPDVNNVLTTYGKDPVLFGKFLALFIFGTRNLRFWKMTDKSLADMPKRKTNRPSLWLKAPTLMELFMDIYKSYFEQCVSPSLKRKFELDFLEINTHPTEHEIRTENLQRCQRISLVKDEMFATICTQCNHCGGDSGKVQSKPQNVLYYRLLNRSVNGVCWTPNPSYTWRDDVVEREYYLMKRDRQNRKLTKKKYSELYDTEKPDKFIRCYRKEARKMFYDKRPHFRNTECDSDVEGNDVVIPLETDLFKRFFADFLKYKD